MMLLSLFDGGALVWVIVGEVVGYGGLGSIYILIAFVYVIVVFGVWLELLWNLVFNVLVYALVGVGVVGDEG